MKQKTFAIMGATGHIGHIICEDLLKRGHTVRAIGRDEYKLQKLYHKGANIVFSEMDDVDTLTEAFTDCYAVFCMIPPFLNEVNYAQYQEGVSKCIIEAIKNSNVDRIVNLSSMGADSSNGKGPVAGLYRHEQALNKLDNLITLIHLRPGYFMENLNSYVPMILFQGVIQTPVNINLPIPMVSTRDIGWKAADFLDSTASFPRCEFDFVGPKDVTLKYVTELLAEYFGMPELYCEQVSYQDAKYWLCQEGMSENVADLFIEMYKSINGNKLSKTELSLTHRGSTTIEAYLLHLAHKHLAPMHS